MERHANQDCQLDAIRALRYQVAALVPHRNAARSLQPRLGAGLPQRPAVVFLLPKPKGGARRSCATHMLRRIEDLKIECGKRHIKNFEEVRFKVLSSLNELLS